MQPLARDRLLLRVRSLAAFGQRVLAGHWAALLVVFSVALWARLHQLGDESVWIDEAISFARANRSYDALIADSIERKHLPTYFLLLKAVLQHGDSEWMMRLPSALFGTVTAVLGYALGAVLYGRGAGLASGLLAASAPILVHYGQEARMYALMAMATTCAMVGLAWLATHPDAAAAAPRRAAGAWAAVLLGAALAMYTHNTSPLFAVTLNAAALVVCLGMPGHTQRWRFARNWLACMAAVVAIWSFWLPTLLRQTATMTTAWRGRAATPEWVSGVFVDLYLLGDEGALACVLVALALWGLYALRARKHLALMLLTLALVGPLLTYAVSQQVPIFYRRLLIWAIPPWFALCAVGLAALPRAAAAIAVCALLLLVPPRLAGYYAAQAKPAWRPLLQKLASETDEHSVILNARAERFLTYYITRKSDPLPRRNYQRVKSQPSQKHLARAVGDAEVFYLVGQTQEEAFKNARRTIAASGHYREVWSERSKNAAVVKYRRKREPDAPP